MPGCQQESAWKSAVMPSFHDTCVKVLLEGHGMADNENHEPSPSTSMINSNILAREAAAILSWPLYSHHVLLLA